MAKLQDKSGFQLDIGCGSNKLPGFIGIDILPLKGVDIIHDLETFPWPLEDESVIRAIASHVLEHINPHKGIFIKFMDEVWRVLKPRAQFAFVVPHASSHGYAQDPTHVNMINETTMHYFDPDPEGKTMGGQLYNFYQPKPWKIEKQYFNPQGNLEVLLSKRIQDPRYGQIAPGDITHERP